MSSNLDKPNSGVPFIPNSAPFTTEQRAWLNGFLAGLFANADVGDAEAATAAALPAKPLLVLFGSQTGTAEGLAKKLATEAGKRGFKARALDMNAFASVDFKQEQRLVIITSTWGDGDPPDNATAFWNHLNSEQAPRLEHLYFSVLALGDKNYSDFCGAGKKFDNRLEQLGGKRVHPRTDCDTDYESTALAWMENLWPALSQNDNSAPPTSTADLVPAAMGDDAFAQKSSAVATALAYNRNNPFPARLLTNRKLNAPASAKDTRHLEISLSGSGLTYEVGDALGVLPSNCHELVTELLKALDYDGEEAVKNPQGEETSLRTALLRHFVVTQIPPSLLQHFSEQTKDTELKRLLEPANKPELDKFLYGREVIDLLLAWPEVKFAPTEFVGFLRKLQPRLYSISSSPKAHPDEVHLTVGVVRYQCHGRQRQGVCSTFFADRVNETTAVPVFVQTSNGFRLPKNHDTPILMIGPGTGIAPFRAFLEERQAVGAKGRNWLFFGDQCQATDFLYREHLETMVANGHLSQLDTAFSRDQAEKIYVQTRLLEHAGKVWSWLEEGAHVYVCGDAKRMAKDVDAALHEIIKTAGGRTAEQSVEYVAKLKQNKRYQRDVY